MAMACGVLAGFASAPMGGPPAPEGVAEARGNPHVPASNHELDAAFVANVPVDPDAAGVELDNATAAGVGPESTADVGLAVLIGIMALISFAIIAMANPARGHSRAPPQPNPRTFP